MLLTFFLGPPCSSCPCQPSIISRKSDGNCVRGEGEDWQEDNADLRVVKDEDKSDELTEVTRKTTLYNIALHVTSHDKGATITSL